MAISSLALVALVALLGNVHCQFGPRDIIPNECREKEMDIFFLLDSSTSIYINDFREQHQFVRDFVSRLDVDDRYTRVGVLTFSDDITRPVLGLTRSRTQDEVRNSITELNLPYRTGVTNTHEAIRYVRENNEFRQDITKVMVVVTDGGSRQQGSTAREARLAREQGFYMFVVGVGQYRDEAEWRAIASEPQSSFVVNITEFRALASVADSLPPRVCPLPPIRTGACYAEETADVVFVAGPVENDRVYDVVEYFAQNTRDGRLGNLQASMLVESCQSATRIDVQEFQSYCQRFGPRGDFVTEQSFNDLLANVDNLITENAGIRPDSRQVVVWFMDDRTYYTLSRTDAFRSLRSMSNRYNTEVVVVGLNMRARDIEIVQQDVENVFNVGPGPISYQTEVMRDFIDRTCDAMNAAGSSLDHGAN